MTSFKKTRSDGFLMKEVKAYTKYKEALGNGYVAKQQLRGKEANARKIFEDIAITALKRGLGIHTDSVIKNITSNKLQSVRSLQVLPANELGVLTKLNHKIKRFLEEQKKLQQIVTAQSAIRRWLIKKRLSTCISKPEERKRILQRNSSFLELLHTEETFLNNVYNFVNRFVLRLRQSDILAPQECAYIFCNIETIAEEHKKLCSRLWKVRNDWPFLGNVGKIFLDIKPLLSAINVYVNHLKTSIYAIEEIKTKKPRFAQFVDNAEEEFECDILAMLMLPVNRISQYESYLQKMLEFMQPGTVEYEDCENASAALAQSSLVIQKNWLESENTAKILKVQQQLKTDKGPLTIMVPGRIFVQDFTFKKHFVCLFNDVILIASKSPKPKEHHKHKVTLQAQKTKLKHSNENCKFFSSKFYFFIFLSNFKF